VKPFSEVLKIVTPEDVELAKKPPVRAIEQAPAGDEVDPRNLMDLLGDIDGLKHEIHERMRRIEAVKQARSVLLEDAARTEALNKKLAEMGKAMSAAQAGILGAEDEAEIGSARQQTGETVAEMEPRPIPVKVMSESVALQWPKTEEKVDSTERAPEEPVAQLKERSVDTSEEVRVMEEASAVFESAFQRLEEAEHSRRDAWKQADEANLEAKRLLEEATSRLDRAVNWEDRASAAFQATQEALASRLQVSQERLDESERRWRLTEQAAAETKRLVELSAAEQVQRKDGVDEEGLEELRKEFIGAYRLAQDRMAEAEKARMDAWKQADEANGQAKQLLEEATLRLDRAINREEQASAAFLTAHEALTTNYQSAQKRLDESEQRWRQMEQATAEAKQLFEQTIAELTQAQSREGSNSEDLGLVRQELTAAYQASQARLDESELRWRQLEQATAETKQLLEQSRAELIRVQSKDEADSASLELMRHEYTTAYQLAQERLNESELRWKQLEQATAETKKQLEQSRAELIQVQNKEAADPASLELMRQEYTASYELAQERLNESELRWKQLEHATAETKKLLEQSRAELIQVQSKETADPASLELMRQEYTTAYQSAQKGLNESELRWKQLEQVTAETKKLLEQSTAELIEVRNKEGLDSGNLELMRQEFAAAHQSAQERLEESEQRWKQTEQATAEMRRLLEQSTVELAQARSKGAADSESLELVWQEFATAYQSALERLDESELRWRQTEQATAETRRLLEQSKAELLQARTRGAADSETLERVRQEFATAHKASQERFGESERRWHQMEIATAETKRLLEQSRAELLLVRSSGEPDSEGLQLVRQEFTAAYQASQERFDESERRWHEMEQATAEMKRLLEQSRAELVQARSNEGSDTAALELVRQEVTAAYQASQTRLDESELRLRQTEQATAEMKRLQEQSRAELAEARNNDGSDTEILELVREELTSAYQASQKRLDESELRLRQTEQATAEMKRLLEQSRAELAEARSNDGSDAEILELVREELTAAYRTSQVRFDESELRLRHTEQATDEMKRLLEQSRAELAEARSNDGSDTEVLELVREELTSAYQASQKRLDESEQRLRQTEQATAEMKRLLEQSRAELAEARGKDGSDTVALELVREELTTAYQSMGKRLEEAEKSLKKGTPLGEGAQGLVDQTAAELREARSVQETAAADLLSARQELTTAYQFAAVAAQRRLDAEAFFQKLGRWAVFATVFSWIAMTWTAWFSFRQQVPIWGPAAMTVVLFIVAFMISKKGKRDA